MRIVAVNLEKDALKRIAEALFGVFALTVGGLIYIRYRCESLLMFDWFQHLGLSNFIGRFRNSGDDYVCGWVKFNMPAGLWLFAYMLVIDAVWGKDNSNAYQSFQENPGNFLFFNKNALFLQNHR